MTPEDHARQNIDQQLIDCGWVIQNMSSMNIMAGQGVAPREFQLATGEADYGLYIGGKFSVTPDQAKLVNELGKAAHKRSDDDVRDWLKKAIRWKSVGRKNDTEVFQYLAWKLAECFREARPK